MNNKKKNYYKYRRNKRKNFTYYCHNNKPFFYRKKYKSDNKNSNILLEDNKSENVILEPVINEIKEEHKGEQLEITHEEKQEEIVLPKLPIIKVALGIVIFVAIVFGVSYSYFNYYQEISRQADITMGEVYVRVLEETTNLTLTRLYPKTDTDARAQNDNYVDFTVSGKNSSATKVLYYTINITDGAENNNKARISRDNIKVDLQQKVNNEYVYLQEAVRLSDFNFEDVIPVNTVSDALTREYRLRLWVSDAVLISDTEENRTYTQSEFANLYATYHVEVSAVDKPVICKRATTLHTEECQNGSESDNNYCYADGYIEGSQKGTTITYGNSNVTSGELHTGDAFDCDVNGDGQFNGTTERFYYVSDYFDTETQEFNTNYAVLIYYRNFVGEVASDNGVAYYGTSGTGNYDNWHGPRVAVAALPVASANPTGNEWRNDILKTADRKVLSCNKPNCTTLSDKTDNGNKTIDQGTTALYTGKAARLLTVPEINAGCGTSVGSTGNLSGVCKFLLEKTKYSSASYGTYGPWLENPRAADATYAWCVDGNSRFVSYTYAFYTTFGTRPAIDVPYSMMAY